MPQVNFDSLPAKCSRWFDEGLSNNTVLQVIRKLEKGKLGLVTKLTGWVQDYPLTAA